ncbi:helix-turn-helix transcriptional regulator [Sutcliffiella horikoshii]|uniref:helix-turn-helix domain-containing protein n=1 Tax=Sutcliffiella horikoshii TaxID=79883 RepID=UPI00204050B7|nr:helix-turn-helix transcriptional regulator [Sutcliffiella horikoshii]MCM3619024.1 helix-turn-helix transcriptional regulator [Sutcliffiella horikoshii]
MREIGENIRFYRERAKLTAAELALKIRVGTGTIEKYESGIHKPDMQTILKISTVLDVPASELLESISSSSNARGLDPELELLIEEVGVKRAKLILRKAKEYTDEDFLNVMQILYDKKYSAQ